MKAIKITLILLIIVSLSFGLWFSIFYFARPLLSKINTPQLTTEQKLEDFDYLYDTMKQNYPFFEVKKRMINYDWLANKDEFRKWIIESKDDRAYYNTLNRIINLMQSGHTNLVNYEFYQDVADLYSDPVTGGYSPSRRDILHKELVEQKAQYWSNMLTAYNNYLPIIFKYVEGSYVVLDGALEDYEIPEGSILRKVGDQNVENYIKSLTDKVYLEFDYKREKQISEELYIFTEPGAIVSLTLEMPDGVEIERRVKEGQMPYEAYERIYGRNDSRNFRTEIMEQGKIAYLKMSSMEYIDEEQFEEDKKTIEDFLKTIEDYPYLIVDIRGNGGGSTSYWAGNLVSRLIQKSSFFDVYMLYRNSEYVKPFINDRYDLFEAESTAKLPPNKSYPPEINNFGNFVSIQEGVTANNPLHFNGKIFLLVDSRVYSAAESFAVYAKTTKWATLVGSTTGGDGVGAEPGYIALPNSGILVRFPVAMGLNPDGSINEEVHTQPDIYVEQNYQDFLAQLANNENPMLEISKHDTVLNMVLDIINKNK